MDLFRLYCREKLTSIRAPFFIVISVQMIPRYTQLRRHHSYIYIYNFAYNLAIYAFAYCMISFNWLVPIRSFLKLEQLFEKSLKVTFLTFLNTNTNYVFNYR